MNTTFDHNKLLKKIARERLKSYGIVQKGSSRFFFKDKGWYVIGIEFQPSGFDKGTYMNIGVDFNFYPREGFAFAFGGREGKYTSSENETQFAESVNAYCDFTIKRVDQLETDFCDIETAIRTLKKDNSSNPWRIFELAALYGLINDLRNATRLLNKVKKAKCIHQYEFDRRKIIDTMLGWMNGKDSFFMNLKGLVIRTRKLKKLPDIELDDLRERKDKPKSDFNIRSLFK
jgi:hypothetical protein